jgi:hypothetical protein
MTIQGIPAYYIPRGQLVDTNGIPTVAYGNYFLNALYQRTGGGAGIIPKVSGALTASGTNQANSVSATSDWNWVTSGSGGLSILPLKPGQSIVYFNTSGSSIKIYPPPGAQIWSLGINNPYTLASGHMAIFFVASQTQLFALSGN